MPAAPASLNRWLNYRFLSVGGVRARSRRRFLAGAGQILPIRLLLINHAGPMKWVNGDGFAGPPRLGWREGHPPEGGLACEFRHRMEPQWRRPRQPRGALHRPASTS